MRQACPRGDRYCDSTTRNCGSRPFCSSPPTQRVLRGSSMPTSRRAFLGASAVLLATGCSGTADVLGLRRPVRIAVSWSGQELRAFHAVLDGLGRLDYPVEVVPLGDDISTAFGPRSARRPDLVMLPQPGLVPPHQKDLESMPDDLADRGRARLWD